MSVELRKEQEKKSGAQRLYEEITAAFREKKYDYDQAVNFFKSGYFFQETTIGNRLTDGLRYLGGPLGKAIIGLARMNEYDVTLKSDAAEDLAPTEKAGNCYFSKRVDEAINMLYPESEPGLYTALELLGNVEYMNTRSQILGKTTVGLFGDELSRKIFGLAYVSANINVYNKLVQDMKKQGRNRSNYVFENGELSEKDSEILDFYATSSWYIMIANAMADYRENILKANNNEHIKAKEVLSKVIYDGRPATFHDELGDHQRFEECKDCLPRVYRSALVYNESKKLFDYIEHNSYNLKKQRREKALEIYDEIKWSRLNTPGGYSKAMEALKKIVFDCCLKYGDVEEIMRYLDFSKHGDAGLALKEALLNIARGHFSICSSIEKQSDGNYSLYSDNVTQTAIVRGAISFCNMRAYFGQEILDKTRGKEEIIRFTDDTTIDRAVTITGGLYLKGITGVIGLYKLPNGLIREIKPEEALSKIESPNDLLTLYDVQEENIPTTTNGKGREVHTITNVSKSPARENVVKRTLNYFKELASRRANRG